MNVLGTASIMDPEKLADIFSHAHNKMSMEMPEERMRNLYPVLNFANKVFYRRVENGILVYDLKNVIGDYAGNAVEGWIYNLSASDLLADSEYLDLIDMGESSYRLRIRRDDDRGKSVVMFKSASAESMRIAITEMQQQVEIALVMAETGDLKRSSGILTADGSTPVSELLLCHLSKDGFHIYTTDRYSVADHEFELDPSYVVKNEIWFAVERTAFSYFGGGPVVLSLLLRGDEPDKLVVSQDGLKGYIDIVKKADLVNAFRDVVKHVEGKEFCAVTAGSIPSIPAYCFSPAVDEDVRFLSINHQLTLQINTPDGATNLVIGPLRPDVVLPEITMLKKRLLSLRKIQNEDIVVSFTDVNKNPIVLRLRLEKMVLYVACSLENSVTK